MSSFCFFMGCAKIAAYQIFRARSASTTYSSSPIGSSPMLAGLCRTAHLAYLLKFHACSFSIWTFSVFGLALKSYSRCLAVADVLGPAGVALCHDGAAQARCKDE